jgi:hypothetical protein
MDDDTKLMNEYFKMKKMSLSELYNLRKIAEEKNKLKFLKVVDLAINERNKEKINKMVI